MKADQSVSDLEGLELGPVIVNMGPQHPSTHGVLRLVVTLDGEMIRDVIPVIGYLHRCKEKLAEKRTYFQYIPIVDRTEYVASMNCEWGYVMTVEKLAGIQPKRAGPSSSASSRPSCRTSPATSLPSARS